MPQLQEPALDIGDRVDAACTVIQDEPCRMAQRHPARGLAYWNQPSTSIVTLTLPALLKVKTAPALGSAGTVSSATTVRLGRTSPALRLMSDASGTWVRLAGYRVRNVVAVGATAVRFAIIATTVVAPPEAGMPASPATCVRRLTPAPIAPSLHVVVMTRVSQIRVGASA